MPALVPVVTFAFWSIVNIRGVALGARFNSLATSAKLLPLCLIAVNGLFFVQGANLTVTTWPSASVTLGSLVYLVAGRGRRSATR